MAEELLRVDASLRAHFPTQSTAGASVLCSACALNQQKIVQLLQAFEGTARQQYEAYARKLDARYPLCATCAYRVGQQLHECEQRALHYQRQTLLVPRAPDAVTGKLALVARQQRQRRLDCALFCVPELAFQAWLMVLAVLQHRTALDPLRLRVFTLALPALHVWLPARVAFCSARSCAFVPALGLFALQLHGIAARRRGAAALATPLFVLLSRVLLINQLVALYPGQPGPDARLALAMAAVGLALILRAGAGPRHGSRHRPGVARGLGADRAGAPVPGPAPAPAAGPGAGFARYSDTQHRYHSFANVRDQHRGILPYPTKPLPGQLDSVQARPGLRQVPQQARVPPLRATKLDAVDPVGLEPMFSSFSLDEKENAPDAGRPGRRSITTPGAPNADGAVPNAERARRLSGAASVYFAWNALLSGGLLGARWLVDGRVALEAVVLAASFSLRGFLWVRLSLGQQMVLLALAVVRLAVLAGLLSDVALLGPALTGHPLFVGGSLAIDALLLALR